ncbi:UPF0481 protein At3g47200-like [Cucurbita moschata]|uniref:UPF0481 protein At3g47200-like n=1 Tax=Cucurbita moschata TaxID=3662 RepID=A0A6J1ECA1_CUCMO|nr:UPF0481 protein At3g47200-like [Cucurbita moschata]
MEMPPLHDKHTMVRITTQNLDSHLENHYVGVRSKGIGASIYRIPDYIMKVNPNAFKPQLVSFGPYHHGELHLLPMEKEKHLIFEDFKRCYGLCTEDIVNEVWDMLEDLQGSYDKLHDEWKTKPDKFLEVMIVDGYFVLFALLLGIHKLSVYFTEIMRDMLLLENQLPMKLLDKLYSMLRLDDDRKVKSLIWESNESLMEKDYLHLLDMYRQELKVDTSSRESKLQVSHLGTSHEIQLATRFHKAGIKLEKGCGLDFLYFNENKGVLTLSFIEMNANIESGLLNAMTFEKLSGIDNMVGSFVILMGNLLEKDEVDSFNQLAKGTVLSMWDKYAYVYYSVNKHCKRPWRIWWTTLKNVSFQSPWIIISALSAIIGFVLLIIQTISGVYGYYLSRRS